MTLPAYCINLDRRPDRWQRMCRRFAAEQIAAERFSAVGDDDSRIPFLCTQNPGLTPLVAACALSHRDLWTLALERGQQRVLILEDDVFFHREWKAIVGQCLARLDSEDAGWDLLLLNAAGIHTWETGLRAANPPLLLSGAYVVNASAMQALLREFRSGCLAADYMLVWLQRCRQRSYFHFPYLALQEFRDSDIGGADQSAVHSIRQWHLDNYLPNFGHLYQETLA